MVMMMDIYNFISQTRFSVHVLNAISAIVKCLWTYKL